MPLREWREPHPLLFNQATHGNDNDTVYILYDRDRLRRLACNAKQSNIIFRYEKPETPFVRRNMMVTRGFTGRRPGGEQPERIPPGQHLVENFPVLSAGPTPRIE